LLDHPRYRVLRLLGQGGMGAVYLAEHRKMERLVALKVISAALVNNPETVRRFQQEVTAAARLPPHPNIVAVHDADHLGDLHFLVMEYVEGENLAAYLAARGPLPPAEACDYVRQAALGLQHAHERGMIHRDIKPHNLMRTPQGQIKILDFGLARCAREHDRARTHLTQTGVVMGTADYMAPEQANDSRTADIRADVYSLGCTLYHLLAGRVLFPDGGVIDKIIKHAVEPPPPLAALRPGLPAGLVRAVEKMLAKDPARRYQTPAEAAEALAPFMTSVTNAEPEPLTVLPAEAPSLPPLTVIAVDEAPTLEYIRDELKWPAAFMSITAVLHLLIALGAGGYLLFGVLRTVSSLLDRDVFQILAIVGTVFFVLSLIILDGARLLLRRRYRVLGWSVVALVVFAWLAAIGWLIEQREPYHYDLESRTKLVLSIFGDRWLVLVPGLITAVEAVVLWRAAREMRKIGSYGVAVFGSVLAMLPTTPLFLLTLPAAIWVLLVLRQDEVRAAFSAAQNAPDRKVSGPASLLMTTAGLNLLLVASAFFWRAMSLYVEGITSAWEVADLILLFLLVVAGFQVVILLAAREMKRLRSRSFALFGSVLSLVPWTPFALLGIPAGIWAFLVLGQPDVRAAFVRRTRVHVAGPSEATP
jgi:hypothetical protein